MVAVARLRLTAIGVVLAMASTACGGAGSHPRPSPSSAPSSGGSTASNPAPSPPVTRTGAQAAPTATGATGPGAPSRCATGMLSAHFTVQGAAAGHRYAALVLTDSSDLTCRVFGYPGLQLLGASGAELPTNVIRLVHTSPRLITLHPGESAWTMLRWSVVPGPGEPQQTQCEPTPQSAWVTPPDERTHLTAPWTMGFVCEHGSIELNPFSPGTGPS